MLRKLTAVLFAAASCLVLSPDANATYLTTNGDIELTSTLNASPPLVDIKRLSGPNGGGYLFTNQTSGTSGTSGAVRTVTVQLLNSVTPFQSGVETTTAGEQLIAVSSISGTILSPGVAKFDSGRVMVYSLDLNAGPFDPTDPTSWGYPVAPAGRIAEYAIAAPMDVNPGIGFGTAITPQSGAFMNISTTSTIPGVPEGQFVFIEDSLAVQNSATTGDNFIRNVDNPHPSSAPINDEGLFVSIQQLVLLDQIGVGSSPLDAADLTVLNAIAGDAGLSDLGASQFFATALTSHTGTGTDFFADPLNLGTSGSGDFFASLDSEVDLIVSNVPEPGSSVLFCTCLAGAFVGWRRRRVANVS